MSWKNTLSPYRCWCDGALGISQHSALLQISEIESESHANNRLRANNLLSNRNYFLINRRILDLKLNRLMTCCAAFPRLRGTKSAKCVCTVNVNSYEVLSRELVFVKFKFLLLFSVWSGIEASLNMEWPGRAAVTNRSETNLLLSSFFFLQMIPNTLDCSHIIISQRSERKRETFISFRKLNYFSFSSISFLRRTPRELISLKHLSAPSFVSILLTIKTAQSAVGSFCIDGITVQ